MKGSGSEADDTRELLADAKRLRDSLSAGVETLDPKLIPLLYTRFSQLVDLAESLIAERERFESRLQRTHAVMMPPEFNSEARQ